MMEPEMTIENKPKTATVRTFIAGEIHYLKMNNRKGKFRKIVDYIPNTAIESIMDDTLAISVDDDKYDVYLGNNIYFIPKQEWIERAKFNIFLKTMAALDLRQKRIAKKTKCNLAYIDVVFNGKFARMVKFGGVRHLSTEQIPYFYPTKNKNGIIIMGEKKHILSKGRKYMKPHIENMISLMRAVGLVVTDRYAEIAPIVMPNNVVRYYI